MERWCWKLWVEIDDGLSVGSSTYRVIINAPLMPICNPHAHRVCDIDHPGAKSRVWRQIASLPGLVPPA
jgi:hypothetical protein